MGHRSLHLPFAAGLHRYVRRYRQKQGDEPKRQTSELANLDLHGFGQFSMNLTCPAAAGARSPSRVGVAAVYATHGFAFFILPSLFRFAEI
jgi:hypothetical protein